MARSALPLLFAAGCFQSIAPESQPDAGSGGAIDAAIPPGPYTTTRAADGTYTTVVDATSATGWTYGDLDDGMPSTASGPWDLRFQRFHLSTNGGISGSAGVEIAPIPGATFAQVTVAPATGWISDAPDGDDANLEPDYAFEQGDGWYDYDVMTHALSAKPLVWAVRTGMGTILKLEITRYYDEAGTAGWLTFRWAPL